MTAHLFDPAPPIVSAPQRASDFQAMLRIANRDRRACRQIRKFKAARLAFIEDPVATVRALRDRGYSWHWICDVLAIDRNEAYDLHRGLDD